jgi:hypothetical protein
MKSRLNTLLMSLAVVVLTATVLVPIASAGGPNSSSGGMMGSPMRDAAGGWMGLGGMWGGWGW